MGRLKREVELQAQRLKIDPQIAFSFLTQCEREIDSRKKKGAKRFLTGSVVDAARKQLNIPESDRDKFFTLCLTILSENTQRGVQIPLPI